MMPAQASINTGTPDHPSSEGFLRAMRQLATSVVLVTTRVDGKPWGLTVSACCSVSASPPMLLISLGAHTVSAQAILKEGCFGVSILSEEQAEVARFGAKPREPKFCHEYCDPDVEGRGINPGVKDALAHLECKVAHTLTVADHIIFVGAIEDVTQWEATRPLLIYEREFHRVGPGAAAG
jgi:flavin reductase ActVB